MTNMKEFNQKNNPKGVLFWIASFVIILLLYSVFSDYKQQSVKEMIYSDFMTEVKAGNVYSANIEANVVTGKMVRDGSGDDREPGVDYKATIPPEVADVCDVMVEHGVLVDVEALNKNDWMTGIIYFAIPLMMLVAFWVIIMRQQGGGRAFSFGKSRARLFTGEKEKTTFKDVAGIDEAKDELQEIIEFLKEPRKFQRLGGKIPKGVLLIGPPGTGKTLLARAIAGEAKVPFFTISGSDFVELFVGVGASRVRDLFDEGKKHSPCLIFIDEIDAVGRQRGAGLGGGHDEREQTLNALLVEMDGFDANVGIIIIAATNRPDILDTALLRPGRFDRRITVPTPDVKGREEILKVHTRKIPLAKNANLKVIARSTPGFTGADLANLINEAALFASRKGKKKIDMRDFEYAKDKVLMGVERKSMIISEKEKEMTAYHEAGHALIATLDKEADPLHKVSIIPRGRALGVTQQLPVDDKHSYSKRHLEAQLCVLLAGRIAEEMFLDMITTGAGNDFERATAIARQMVCDWGMSPLGPIHFGRQDDMVFLGRDMATHNEYSEETARKIDNAIKELIDNAYERTTKTLEENRDVLVKIALGLLERESLSAKEIDLLIGGEELTPLDNGKDDEVVEDDDDNDDDSDNDNENDDENDDDTGDIDENDASDDGDDKPQSDAGE